MPKPMVPIGDRPILWHIMKYYAHFGHKDFILCLGYKAEAIKEYFLNYNEALSNDFVLDGRRQAGRAARAATSTTGGSRSSTPGCSRTIGERLRAVEPHLDDEEIFLANYGDGLTDAPLDDMIDDAQARRQDRAASSACSRTYQLPRRRRSTTTAASRRSTTSTTARTSGSTAASSSSAARSSTTSSGRGPGRGAVPAPDRRGPAGGLPLRGLLGADGHAQGQAAARRACTRPAVPPWRMPQAAVDAAGARAVVADAAGTRSRCPARRTQRVLAIGCHAGRHRDRLRRHVLRCSRQQRRRSRSRWVVLSAHGDARRARRGRARRRSSRRRPRKRIVLARRSATASSPTSAAQSRSASRS